MRSIEAYMQVKRRYVTILGAGRGFGKFKDPYQIGQRMVLIDVYGVNNKMLWCLYTKVGQCMDVAQWTAHQQLVSKREESAIRLTGR